MEATDPALQQLVEREAFAEAIELLTPGEFVVAILRIEGLDDGQIAALLGIKRRAVNLRMVAARRRIMEGVPELRGFLDGRKRGRGRAAGDRPPLERGWICSELAGLRKDAWASDCGRRRAATRQIAPRRSIAPAISENGLDKASHSAGNRAIGP